MLVRMLTRPSHFHPSPLIQMKVGFFLHTPFPSSEIYRTLPVREDLLKAVLGSDLIGVTAGE